MNWIWTIGAPLVRLVMGWCFRVHIEGIEHVPAGGAVTLAPNHVSVLDGPVLAATTGAHRRRATRSLVTTDVFSGLRGWILRQSRQIPIRRGAGDRGALDDAIEALRAGSCVGIFAEGRVNDTPDKGVQRIRSGLTRIALPAASLVVPIGIWGTQSVWPRSGLVRRALLRRPRLAVVYGEPLIPAPTESPSEFRARFLIALEAQVRRARSRAGDPEGPSV